MLVRLNRKAQPIQYLKMEDFKQLCIFKYEAPPVNYINADFDLRPNYIENVKMKLEHAHQYTERYKQELIERYDVLHEKVWKIVNKIKIRPDQLYLTVLYELSMLEDFRSPENDVTEHKIYDEHGNTGILTKRIGVDPDQTVYECLIDNKTKVVKWSEDIEEEIKNCKIVSEIANHGYDYGWNFEGLPVLMMDKMEKINSKDDPYLVGVDVLKFLQSFHKIGCHSDIKRDNILKNTDGKYSLIDFAHISLQKKGHGYLRIAFPRVGFYKPSFGHVTTYREDLIELAFTINSLILDEEDESIFNVDEECEPILWQYLEHVRLLPEKYPGDIDYSELISILERGIREQYTAPKKNYNLANLLNRLKKPV